MTIFNKASGMIDQPQDEHMLTLIGRASKDLRESAKLLQRHEARYLVDLYYQIQEYRKRSGNQARAADEDREPHALVGWVFDAFDTVEKSISAAMKVYANEYPESRWAMSIHGIGHVLAAGLLAHIDVEPWKCKSGSQKRCRADAACSPLCGYIEINTAGKIWRFAGLDPTVTWDRNTKRPWNARLKVLCWKIGDSFVKQKAKEKDIYGKLYEIRKKLEVDRNESGRNSEAAATILKTRKIKDKDLRARLESGRLSDGQIDLRARRWAVKIFLAHYHHVAHELHYGKPPPKPYVIEHLGHTDYIGPPNWKDGKLAEVEKRA